MYYSINDKNYHVEIVRKKNKNTYIRVKKDLTILVTTSLFVTKNQIKKLLDTNKDSLIKMIDKTAISLEKNNDFYYLGKKYDIIYVSSIDKVDIYDNKIYVKDQMMLDKWYKKEIIRIFDERLNYCYNLYNEDIPFPKLKIRTMKTRWGVCNKKDNSVTLNQLLMRYQFDIIDYVIIHELSHFIHFNHSKDFWDTVFKYCPSYKKYRKKLKE